MKTILTIIIACVLCNTQAQTLGKIVYYEGKVEIGSAGSWNTASINMEVNGSQSIRTVGDAMAEIAWSNGKKSVVGPNSTQVIQSLFNGCSSTAKAETEGVFKDFKAKVKTDARRGEEGGIRRTEITTANQSGQNDIYWKEDNEILFEEAYAYYESKEFSRAIAALQAFLHQKPKDDMAGYALFALGHCYIMENNNEKAKEVLTSFIALYPNDPLKPEAEKVLAKL